MDQLETKETVQEDIKENKKERKTIDFLAFFIAPLFVLVMMELMHLWHHEVWNHLFADFYFIAKMVISYLFLLGMQGALLVIIHNLAVVHTIQTVVMWCMCMISEVLIEVTGDPLLPSDFLLADNMGDIASFVEIPLLIQCVVSALFGVGSIVLFFLRRKKRKTKLGIKSKIALSLAAIIFFSASVYEVGFNRQFKYNFLGKMKVKIDAFNPVSNYYDNGFVLTFFPRIGELRFEKPEGYNKEKILEIKNKTKVESATTNVKPNIIAIQSEAFWDITKLPGTTFSEDPMKLFKTLGTELTGKTGKLITPVFGGGTCLPEFEFLTGFSINFFPSNVYPYIQAVNKQTPSIVSTFKDNGYQTYALHPYKKNFYARNKAYPLLGFETFDGEEALPDAHKVGGYYVSDMDVTKQLIKAFETKTKDRIFAFAVTMENHGGYEWKRYSDYDITVENQAVDNLGMLNLKEYTQGVLNANKALGTLVNYFRYVSEPTIIVLYGDHLPLLGSGGKVFSDTGFAEKGFSQALWTCPQALETPYVVWANYDLDLSVFPDRLSAGNLGHIIGKISGLENTPWYYSAFDRFYKEYPVFSLYKTENVNRETVPGSDEKLTAMKEEYRYLQYDILHGKRYAEQ